MSHLTARDIRSLGQLIDASLTFLKFTNNRDAALQMVLQGTKALLPFCLLLLKLIT